MPTRNQNQSYTNNSYPRDMPRYIDTYTYILGTRHKHKTSAQAVAPSRSTLSGLLISWSTCHCPHTKTTTAPLGGEQSSVWNNHHIYHKYLNNDIWYAMHVCRGGIRSNAHPLSTCQNQTNRYQINARAGTPANMG